MARSSCLARPDHRAGSRRRAGARSRGPTAAPPNAAVDALASGDGLPTSETRSRTKHRPGLVVACLRLRLDVEADPARRRREEEVVAGRHRREVACRTEAAAPTAGEAPSAAASPREEAVDPRQARRGDWSERGFDRRADVVVLPDLRLDVFVRLRRDEALVPWCPLGAAGAGRPLTCRAPPRLAERPSGRPPRRPRAVPTSAAWG